MTPRAFEHGTLRVVMFVGVHRRAVYGDSKASALSHGRGVSDRDEGNAGEQQRDDRGHAEASERLSGVGVHVGRLRSFGRRHTVARRGC
jgi:hypothetical protein